jgi:hypothetical protein
MYKYTSCPVFVITIFLLLLFCCHLCHYSVGGAWLYLGFYESFQYPVWVINPATGVHSEGVIE